jgi:Ala-tRNA(Pro) deacylase
LLLIADPSLLSRYDELAFNAGILERSIILRQNFNVI